MNIRRVSKHLSILEDVYSPADAKHTITVPVPSSPLFLAVFREKKESARPAGRREWRCVLYVFALQNPAGGERGRTEERERERKEGRAGDHRRGRNDEAVRDFFLPKTPPDPLSSTNSDFFSRTRTYVSSIWIRRNLFGERASSRPKSVRPVRSGDFPFESDLNRRASC